MPSLAVFARAISPFNWASFLSANCNVFNAFFEFSVKFSIEYFYPSMVIDFTSASLFLLFDGFAISFSRIYSALILRPKLICKQSINLSFKLKFFKLSDLLWIAILYQHSVNVPYFWHNLLNLDTILAKNEISPNPSPWHLKFLRIQLYHNCHHNPSFPWQG